MKKGMKKGQTEIIGLVIIVLLISIGFLFLVSFSFGKEDKQNVFVRQGLAISTLEAVIKANPLDILEEKEGCTYGQESIPPLSEFIEACMNDDQSFFSELCPHKDICIFTNSQISRLLEKTIQRYWQKDYYFRVLDDSGGAGPIVVASPLGLTSCPANQDSSGPYQLETKSGIITLELNICS